MSDLYFLKDHCGRGWSEGEPDDAGGSGEAVAGNLMIKVTWTWWGWTEGHMNPGTYLAK